MDTAVILYAGLAALTIAAALSGLAFRQRIRAAEASALQLRRLFDVSTNLIAVAGADGYLQRVNGAWTRILGFPESELLAAPYLDFVHPDDRPRAAGEMAALQAGRQIQAFEARMRCRDGGVRWILWSGWLDPDTRQLYGIGKDVTDSRAAQEQIARSEALLGEAQEIGRFGSWEWDIASDTLTWSDQMRRIFGIAPGEPLSYQRYLDRVQPEDRERVMATVEKAYADCQPYTFEHRIVRGTDGAVRIVHGRGRVITDASGRAVRMTGTGQDITEAKLAEEALRASEARLRESEEALAARAAELARSNAELERFAYAASHDLQEPLRSVTEFAELLARRYRGRLDADADEFIRFMVDGAGRMQQMIRDLLEYARVGGAFDPRPVNLCGALASALENLQTSIDESGAVVTRDPLPTIEADPARAAELLQNLVGNAIKFRGADPPRIHVSAARQGGEWIVGVRDNGIGLDPRHAERIFVIFQRLHTRAEYEGSGMGLAICRRIVERLGGRIWVESAPGRGSTFYFAVPAAVTRPAAASVGQA